MENKNLKILVVDDEEDLLDLLKYNLAKEGFQVFTAKDGEEGLKLFKEIEPNLAILDVVMPKMSGIKLCQYLKSDERYKSIPIMMLTAKSTEKNIVDGLNIGADDYVTKPFSIKVLIARVNALFRRNRKIEDNEILKIGGIKINLNSREVFLNDEKLELTFSRFQILALFLRYPDTVFSRKEIIVKIKGEDYPVTERAIDVHIVELRRKLKAYGKQIKSIRSVGYKFDTEGIA
ncbi:MAG TPA: DNA-binding response regulator [Lentisphaeria bacterium]|nr:MAG: hypothetical protein A2X47_13040 [Lentisphaerae bacterium GWF2_38_69]HBM16021.1 DNA-binding response regulator [Lentisphaeria bacterium]